MIDELDKEIIEQLTMDARQSSKVLAKKLNVDSSTIRRRIHRLVEDGVIYVTILLTHEKTGVPVRAITGLNIEIRDLEACLKTLGAIPECKFVSVTTGRFNVMFTILCRSTEIALGTSQKIISRLHGVKNSETFVCKNIVKSINPLDCNTPNELKDNVSLLYPMFKHSA
jgi:Lrp/AsnC family transcriptional regulator, regulator for asnA, asnC and gidA